jgi:hypothetical protein
MASTDKNQTEIINAWQSLIEQSVKANTAFLKESAKIFTSLLSQKIEPKDLLKINTDIINAATNNFIKLNIANTENLMNFGVTVSRNFFSFTDTKSEAGGADKEADVSANGQGVSHVSSQLKNEINLAVVQGEKITTAFYLNSHNAFAQNGKFSYGSFIDVAGTNVGLTMMISPAEFILEPGRSLKIDISISAPKNIRPGKYSCNVKLEGMDNQEFDIVVAVAEQVSPIAKKAKPSPARKTAIKRKARKPGHKK